MHIKQDSHFIKLACVPAEPVPWESGIPLCVDEVIKRVSNCMSLSQWGKGRNGEGTLGQGTCRPPASSIGAREKGDLRRKPRKRYESPCVTEGRAARGRGPEGIRGCGVAGWGFPHFFAQYPGPGLVKDLRPRDCFESHGGIGRQAFGPDVTIVSVGTDMVSSDHGGHCPGDAF